METELNKTLELLRIIGQGFHDCFTIVDSSTRLRPCIYVNSNFTLQTGYTAEDAIGKNLSFLQGAATSLEAVGFMRQAFEDQKAIAIDLINYKKSGSTFLNRLVMLPLEIDNKLFYLGFQNISPHHNKKINQKNFSSNAEIKHILNNLMTTLMMTAEYQLLSDTNNDLDHIIKPCQEMFLEINHFCKNIDSLNNFNHYNPYSDLDS